MEVSPTRFGTVAGTPGWATGRVDAVCFSVNQPDVRIGGAAVFLTNQQVGLDMTLELLEMKGSTADQSRKENWTTIISTRKTLTFAHQDTTHFKYPLEFDRTVKVQVRRKYALCLIIHTAGHNTFYGQQGQETSRCDDEVTFTFSNCPFSQYTNRDGGQIPSILYTRSNYMVAPSRFGSVNSSGVAMDGTAGHNNSIGFSVNKADVKIHGIGVFVSYAQQTYNVSLELISAEGLTDQQKTQKQNWAVLASKKTTVAYNGCNAAPIKVLFDKCLLIKKDVTYGIWMVLQGPQNTYYGQNGQQTVTCDDGLIIQFSACPESYQTAVANGQTPCVLYSRGGLPSSQRSLFRMLIPLKQDTFNETSMQQQLNRYCFSIDVTKTEMKFSAQLICEPAEKEKSWFVNTQTNLLLLHPKYRKKGKKWEVNNNFKAGEESKSLLDLCMTDLVGDDFADVEKCSLHVEVRYTKVSKLPPYSVEDLKFDEPWKRSDVAFVFDDGEHVHCHRSVLALASPVFEAMLFCDSKERTEGSIPLTGKDRGRVIQLLRFLYPRETPEEFDEESAYSLAQLCHEYQIKRLERKAEETLIETTTEDTALRSLDLAFKCGFEDLKEKALRESMKLDAATLEEDWFFFQLDAEVQLLVKDARLRC